ncbi:alpha/beta hydrolase [Nocardioides sp. TF02-7]|uniref:alpha/beta fold hydrolase n=1 Tax=Nocardioides sp. TF02-7 TaxID=2917724 RepID=UPI001F06939A|nr:alpha/beta hydrolase [Nocardioides sp. TF02-7]UMG93703.1 alpha/beta hydrolase [Nocardioides sp. TF02-7]
MSTVVRRHYVDTAWGQVHALTAGTTGPWIGLFHESPLSSEVWVDVLAALAPDARVVAFDTPGYGASTPPDGPGHEIPEYAAVLAEAAAGLGMSDAVFGGVHTGASIAIEVAHRFAHGVRGVVLSGVALYDEAERAEHLRGWTPPVPSDTDGAEFRWAVERYQRIWPELTPGLLHTAAVELLRVKDRYHWGYQAAFRHDPAEPLAALDVPVLLLDAEFDLLADKDPRALELAKDARLVVLEGLHGQPHLRAPGDYARHLLAFARELAAEGASR